MKRCKLGDVLDVKRGTSLSGEHYSKEGNFIRLTLGNFRYPDNGFKNNTSKDDIYYIGDVKREFILKKGDIITPLTEQIRGLLGNTATIPEDEKYIQSGDIGLIIPTVGKVNKRYAYYLMSSPIVKKQLDCGSQQTKIRHTSPKYIKNCIAFISEDIKQQEKIAKLLDDINEKIENNNAINNNLEQQLTTLYDYWFTQFDFPNEEGKPYRSSGGKMKYNDITNQYIPENWDVKTVSELLNVVTGKEDANFSTTNGNYKFFTCSSDVLNCGTPAFSGSAILIAGNGDFNVKHYSGKFNAYQRTYVLIPNNKKYYSVIYVSSKKLIYRFKKASNGSIVRFITKSDIENIPIFIANDDSLYQSLNLIIKQIELNQIENEKLIKQRDFLLPLLMNGQATIE